MEGTNKLLKDKWAIKAITYLVRKDYSTEEIMEALVLIGIQKGKVEEND